MEQTFSAKVTVDFTCPVLANSAEDAISLCVGILKEALGTALTQVLADNVEALVELVETGVGEDLKERVGRLEDALNTFLSDPGNPWHSSKIALRILDVKKVA